MLSGGINSVLSKYSVSAGEESLSVKHSLVTDECSPPYEYVWKDLLEVVCE